MFEDSTFESNGRISTRSRGWMVATLLFNGSILLALILIPLIYPEALPRQVTNILIGAPPPPSAPDPPRVQPAHTSAAHSDVNLGAFTAPQPILMPSFRPSDPEPAYLGNTATLGDGPDGTGGLRQVFPGQSTAPSVRMEPKGPVRVSGLVEEGLILQKSMPAYSAIARAAGIQGTVVLTATISKTGTIENLRVVSGPVMLQQAALDAVKTWRYKPYKLDGQPVEVETTVSVIFSLGR
jgi:periplasmic protein TonB